MSIEKAVSFAASMIRKGQYIGTALNIAANYYKVKRADVQRGLASRSGKSQKGKTRPPKPVELCEDCKQEACWRCTHWYGMHKSSFFMCADCGQKFPAHWENEPLDGHKWTRYTPTKNTKKAKESGNSDG